MFLNLPLFSREPVTCPMSHRTALTRAEGSPSGLNYRSVFKRRYSIGMAYFCKHVLNPINVLSK